MRYVIVIVSGVVLLGLLAYIASTRYYENKREESYKEKIVGTWYPSDEENKGYLLKFANDGTMMISGKGEKIHGTYKITSDEIIVVIIDRDKEAVSRLLIKKLTSNELIFESMEDGRTFIFHQER